MRIIFANFVPCFTNIIFIMKRLIIVDVLLRTNNPKEPFKKVFSRQVLGDAGLLFSYDEVVSSLLFLYGSDSIVSISQSYVK